MKLRVNWHMKFLYKSLEIKYFPLVIYILYGRCSSAGRAPNTSRHWAHEVPITIANRVVGGSSPSNVPKITKGVPILRLIIYIILLVVFL